MRRENMEDTYLTIFALLGAYILVILAVLVVYYVVSSLAYMKALRALGYANPWMAWIPILSWYAIADAAADHEEQVTLFGSVTVPAMLYKLWWLIMFVCAWVPVVGSILSAAVRIIFLGNCFMKMYARLDHTSEKDQQVIGYISGFIPLVAVVKFLAGKYK